MGLAPIPEEWRKDVCTILRKNDKHFIDLKIQAEIDFFKHFPMLWEYQLFDGLCQYLQQDSCVGRQVLGMRERGEVYEFIFTLQGRKLYSKLNLTPSGKLVIVYSAHPPRKGDTL